MKRHLLLLPLIALTAGLAGCGGSTLPASSPAPGQSTQSVFDSVSPSVVAILNDDTAQREEEAKQAMKDIGLEAHAPKKVVDVSLRKEPMPHGTGFLIEGGIVITAAHVIHSPEQLKITTKNGQTVEAKLVHIDEVRDVALLEPKTKLEGVPALRLAETNPTPGRRVWALGHTGAGLWALAWGVSEGITSGIVEMLGAKLLLFDAPVYPGFSGGPVITLDDAGKPAVVGVNHAILFTGGMMPVASISSASSVADIKEVVAKRPAAIEPKLAEFAKSQSSASRAELFVTRNLSVHKDPQMLTTAAIVGNERTIETGTDDVARVPVVGMLFALPKGKQDVTFELQDPDDVVVETVTKHVKVGDFDRVSFASADFRFEPKVSGRYDIVAKVAGKVVGRTDVWIEDPDDDDQPIDDDDQDDAEDGDPRVDVVVASYGRDEPFALGGIRSGWVEWRYPRRVGFTWYARGSRGWSGTNVAISAFVLDERGKIVGRGVGCMNPEVRPERTWQCSGTGGTPLLTKEGRYDVVFAMNDRPIAVWPMEAMVRTSAGAGSALDRWMQELKKQHAVKKHKPTVAPTPKPKAPEKPADAPKTPAKPAPKKAN
ncbi:MAG: trypsin-like peptidase domain-containing protein [Labilithrix sp.]|nr:trypsin-like peptidase domain-containing protein [Labilithrix sp.]